MDFRRLIPGTPQLEACWCSCLQTASPAQPIWYHALLFVLLIFEDGAVMWILPCWCSSPSWQSCTAPPTSPSQCSPCHCPPATVGNKMNWLVGSINVYLYGIDISKEGLSCLEKEWMEYCKNLLILKRIEVIMTNIILAPCQSSMQRMMWWHCWLSWQKRSGLDQGDPGGTKMQICPILFENWVCCQISKLGSKTALFSRLLFEETLNMEPDSQAST